MKYYVVKRSFNASKVRNTALEVQSVSIETALYAVEVDGKFHSHCFEFSTSYRPTTLDYFWFSTNAKDLHTYCKPRSLGTILLHQRTTQNAVRVQKICICSAFKAVQWRGTTYLRLVQYSVDLLNVALHNLKLENSGTRYWFAPNGMSRPIPETLTYCNN